MTIDGGAKISGEFAGFELGMLSVLMEGTADVDSQVLSVARGTRQVSDKMRLGFMATKGDPQGDVENSLVGFDALYKSPNFLGGGLLQIDSFYQRTVTSDMPDDDSFGVRALFPNDKWFWALGAKEIGENFSPELGFVNRSAIRDYSATWRRRERTAKYGLRYYEFGTSHGFITDLTGDLETRETSLNLGFQTQGTDTLDIDIFENFEKISIPFSLPKGLIVDTGNYQNDGVSLRLETSRVRP